jgi:hypothetical protein
MFMQKKTATPQSPAPNGVPRGIPHKAPPSIQEQIERLRRWCLLLGGGLALLLVASVAAFAFFRNQPRPEVEEEKVSLADRDATPKPEKRLLTLKTDVRDMTAPKKIALAPSVGAASAESKKREPLLETIGGLSVVHLYQSYLNIGLLADAAENETYTRAEAASIMATVNELVNLVEKQLTKLPSSGLSEEDETALEGVRLLTALLRTQSNSLLAFWAGGEETHATRYHEAREQSWVMLKGFLGLDDE